LHQAVAKELVTLVFQEKVIVSSGLAVVGVALKDKINQP
jgi:hypothetical protein